MNRVEVGDYFLRKNKITNLQLEYALSFAREKNIKITESLLELEYITHKDLIDMLLDRLKPQEFWKRKKLGEVLLDVGLVTEEQLQHALEVQRIKKKRIGEVLSDLGYATKDQITEALADKLQLELVNCSEYTIDEELKKLVPKEMAKKHLVFPLAKKDDALVLAMADPLNLDAINEITFATKMKIIPVVAYEWSIELALKKNYGESIESVNPNDELITLGILQTELEKQKDIDFKALQTDDMSVNVEALYRQSSAPKIVRLVDMLIVDASKKRASDIHIEPRSKYVQVRFRIDGELQNIFEYPKDLHEAVVSRIKIIAKLDITNRRTSQDGSTSVVSKGKTIDLRISTLPTVYGEKVVLRLLDQSKGIVPLEKLSMPSYVEKAIIEMLRRPQGMFLVTGPTGCDKTTTLYACLNYLRSDTRNIISIEDPVEYN